MLRKQRPLCLWHLSTLVKHGIIAGPPSTLIKWPLLLTSTYKDFQRFQTISVEFREEGLKKAMPGKTNVVVLLYILLPATILLLFHVPFCSSEVGMFLS